jgi:hypothetical protein
MPSNFRDKNGTDPFSDEEGKNPFAEDGEDLPPPADNGPYAASAEGPYTHRPGDFETVLTHRGGTILGLGIVGTLVALIGLLTWYFWMLAAGALALAATLPACVFAMKDLRAMDMGAMDPAGKRRTIVGAVFGLIGTAVAAVSVVLFVGQVFLPAVGF